MIKKDTVYSGILSDSNVSFEMICNKDNPLHINPYIKLMEGTPGVLAVSHGYVKVSMSDLVRLIEAIRYLQRDEK